MSGPLRVAVLGARGRLGAHACDLLGRSAGFELVARWNSGDDWRTLAPQSGAQVVLESTRAGLGALHARALLEQGVRVVVATSGVSLDENRELDRLARERGLGGLVVPNLSIGAALMLRFSETAARWFGDVEIVEGHHPRKADAPSGTALETARRIAAARAEAGRSPSVAGGAGNLARGGEVEGVPVHSLRLPGIYARQEVTFGSMGELLRIEHETSGPEAYGPGLLAALRHAARATGVARGIEAALDG
ncbi:MAG: 4-hydroxy-tetrahydrodipicolinate reductase [Planctomycetota bacterium]|nr:4-hydroxy-tetrahydrodipicolinate reductase [Planctomycetota bacterium]